jgi:hypothetical protein
VSELADFGGGIDRVGDDTKVLPDEPADDGLSMPVCCIDGCETEVPGLFDGWDAHNREGTACNDCRDYYNRHNHWPDEEPEHCVECLVDDGAVKHECDDAAFDAVVLEPGSECEYCGDEIADTEEPEHD